MSAWRSLARERAGGDAEVATWSRRLSSAQAKQPGTRRSGTALPGSLPADILPDDQHALRALGSLAKVRPDFSTQVTVRSGSETSYTELEIRVRHVDGDAVFEVIGEAGTVTTAPVAATEAAEVDDGPSGDRVI